MRNWLKWIGFLCMLVVMMVATASPVFSIEPRIDCCKHEAGSADTCNDDADTEKGCKNEGNPFQFCACCVHAWLPAYTETSIIQEQPVATIFVLHGQDKLPLVPVFDFWQPPRFL
ncbi:hypothetical protein LX64_04289 [Chitinophaga skermanii]|uniref:Uncharacterized protein n=1 Tax=Chitinophaga skermanii TaxID=331697 RepID=A0A327Q7F9_9BACT|nr:hypothetical protein [Chitinophaga skermanii]RAI99737.1 hypothetical protein LX64_04289 [Chitinophaga skermanii]